MVVTVVVVVTVVAPRQWPRAMVVRRVVVAVLVVVHHRVVRVSRRVARDKIRHRARHRRDAGAAGCHGVKGLLADGVLDEVEHLFVEDLVRISERANARDGFFDGKAHAVDLEIVRFVVKEYRTP